MRSIVSLSLPAEIMALIKEEMKRRHFTSVSEYFRDLLRRHYEDALFEELLASQKEIAEGKGKVLKSLRDLR